MILAITGSQCISLGYILFCFSNLWVFDFAISIVMPVFKGHSKESKTTVNCHLPRIQHTFIECLLVAGTVLGVGNASVNKHPCV